MQRHEPVMTLAQARAERERRHKSNEPPNWKDDVLDKAVQTCICRPDKPFRSLCDFWHHQAEEYERLLEHYAHFFEPKKAVSADD